MADRYCWRIQTEDILFIPGVIRGFNLACDTLAEPGGGVFIQTPTYPPMLVAPRHAGLKRQGVEIKLSSDGSYEIDWDVFESSLTPEARLSILCNPHTPVGRVFRRDELERMADICLRRGLTICSEKFMRIFSTPGMFKHHLHRSTLT
jgi:cystathionine beta-lyase